MVSIVRMPLSLPVFGVNKADEVIAAFPNQVLGYRGALPPGGSVAALYARSHPYRVQGLFYGRHTLRRAMTCQTD